MLCLENGGHYTNGAGKIELLTFLVLFYCINIPYLYMFGNIIIFR